MREFMRKNQDHQRDKHRDHEHRTDLVSRECEDQLSEQEDHHQNVDLVLGPGDAEQRESPREGVLAVAEYPRKDFLDAREAVTIIVVRGFPF
jgi:hypothetical protein